ncbi:MAG: adenylyltransferase/cytidyltransferase family protein [Paludibacteraceae bacterium]|nr:adenylyltransferase/cytidyltransferase family protein [Paludibacteraceae bacterium]
MIDKSFCMSSYLAFRYIECDEKDFYEDLHHKNIDLLPDEDKMPVKTADEIGLAIDKQISMFKGKKRGILLSGGMDSAIVASYMNGGEAYTFRFLGGDFQKEELARAEYYAKYYNLNLHYVDITWDTVLDYVDACMKAKCAPVHSIEPQILQAALQAKNDGVEVMFVGESSDLVFGGMDKLLSKDWMFDEFMNRYMFTDPNEVLKNPVDMSYLFERYRQGKNIDFLSFMDNVFSIESSSSYWNAFAIANMPYYDPYAHLKMSEPLDLYRVRNGEPKYLIRELMAKRYPDIPVPDKNPMPRPVDFYFKDWTGPTRPEFKRNIDMSRYSGNQKWQMWCLERFLNMCEPIKIGYTTGVYDLFHIGHLNLLNKAKSMCDYLIVGVSTDDLVEYKGKRSVIPFEERKSIVGALKCVDEVVTQENMNKLEAWHKYGFNVMFVGDDWKGTEKWNRIEEEMKSIGVEVVYFPYTKGTSSTLINETLRRLRGDK